MSEADVSKAAEIDELERRAVVAWGELVGQQREPLDLEVLQHESARSVLRLRVPNCGGASAPSVIAKRCRIAAALKEHAIYADVLPKLPLASLHLHGMVTESREHAWLFMEDADAVASPYDPRHEDHRVLLGRWLGLMHTVATRLAAPAKLDDRGPASFREELRCLCATLERVRANSALAGDDVAILASILSQCHVIASHWDHIEVFCSRMPRTLVHGDLKEDHIRIREDRAGPAVLLFDWNESGWGVPTLDAAKFLGYSVRPDIGAYRATVQASWPMMDVETIRRLGFVGEACRCTASARWEAEKLRFPWVERPMTSLRLYEGWMRDVVRAEPWVEQPAGGPEARIAKARAWF